jgi:hypothetical protein
MKFLYSIGNRKLGKDTLIFNMTSAMDCPSKARGLCKHPGRCYALKAEKMYPACLPYRRRQAFYWHQNTAGTIAADILAALKRHKAVKYISFSESGDFKDQKDVRKLYAVARIVRMARPEGVKDTPKFYGYTARRDLRFTSAPDNVIVNGSGFMLDNKYTAVETYTPGAFRCSEQECPTCTACKTGGKKIIENLYH